MNRSLLWCHFYSLFTVFDFRAILKDQSKNKIPKDRLAELEQCLKDFYKVEQLDQTILDDAANLDPK